MKTRIITTVEVSDKFRRALWWRLHREEEATVSGWIDSKGKVVDPADCPLATREEVVSHFNGAIRTLDADVEHEHFIDSEHYRLRVKRANGRGGHV